MVGLSRVSSSRCLTSAWKPEPPTIFLFSSSFPSPSSLFHRSNSSSPLALAPIACIASFTTPLRASWSQPQRLTAPKLATRRRLSCTRPERRRDLPRHGQAPMEQLQSQASAFWHHVDGVMLIGSTNPYGGARDAWERHLLPRFRPPCHPQRRWPSSASFPSQHGWASWLGWVFEAVCAICFVVTASLSSELVRRRVGASRAAMAAAAHTTNLNPPVWVHRSMRQVFAVTYVPFPSPKTSSPVIPIVYPPASAWSRPGRVSLTWPRKSVRGGRKGVGENGEKSGWLPAGPVRLWAGPSGLSEGKKRVAGLLRRFSFFLFSENAK
jgi:hypothetical protein